MQTSSPERISAYNEKGWWDNQTLFQIFSEAVKQSPDNIALVDPPNRNALVHGQPERMTFLDLSARVDGFIEWFYQNGLRQGDTILVQMPNTVEIVILYIAAARLGLIVSPVAIQYGNYELSFMRDTVEPKAYIAFEKFRGEDFISSKIDLFDHNCKVIVVSETGVNLDTLPEISSATTDYLESIHNDPNDIFTICWTSGTTGRSKGVPRSHNQWLASALACEDSINLPMGSIYLNPFPFINMAAIGGFLYFWLRNQGRMILHHPFDGPVFLSQLQDEKVAYALAPPALLNKLIATKEQIKAGFDLSCVRLIGSGSAPLSPHMIKGFKDEFGIDIVNVFGSNEGSALLSGPRDVADPEERALYFPRFGRDEHNWPNRISDRIRTKLINIESEEEVIKPGTPGELCVAGATIFDGYYESPEDNAQAFTKDGYFRSGDLFEIAGEKNQYYQFVGRCKALIIRGGVNISPEELDELLNAHPKIQEAAVASYPDEIMGEKICAFVVPFPDETVVLEDIKAFLKAKSVAKFKWPEKIKTLEALPRNPMNKVVRSELQALLK